MSPPAAKCPPSPSKVFTPPVPTRRRCLRCTEESCPSSDNSPCSHMEKERPHDTSNVSEAGSYHDTEMTESSSEQNEENESSPSSQNRSKPSHSPERIKSPVNPQNCPRPNYVPESFKLPVNLYTSSTGKIIFRQLFNLSISGIVILGISVIISQSSSTAQTESTNISISQSNMISESLKSIKATFYNQESDIWNDISSAINETISRTPKKPSIILLFANERSTMNCLATELANVCKTILHAEDYLEFNPKDFGDDAGVIITTLNKYPLERKKIVIIRDILNINAEGIKALHNLCDRENPLIAEAIFILTMQTTSYKSPQKKLDFVEKQIYNKLLKSIDRDVLMALVTRITDGAIISVQSQPKLSRYC